MCNAVTLITASGNFTAPMAGNYTVFCCAGGNGAGAGGVMQSNTTGLVISPGVPGLGGNVTQDTVQLTSGQVVACTIGAGGTANTTSTGSALHYGGAGGSTTFGTYVTAAAGIASAGVISTQSPAPNNKVKPGFNNEFTPWGQGLMTGVIGGPNGAGFGKCEDLGYRQYTGGGGSTPATRTNAAHTATASNLSGAAGFILIIYGKRA